MGEEGFSDLILKLLSDQLSNCNDTRNTDTSGFDLADCIYSTQKPTRLKLNYSIFTQGNPGDKFTNQQKYF